MKLFILQFFLLKEGEEFEVATKHKIRIYDEENNDIKGDLLQDFQDLESVKDKKKQLQLKYLID